MDDLQFFTRILKFQRILLTKKRDEMLHHQQGREKEKLALVYSVPTTTSPYTCPVDGVAHRNIGFILFVHRFRLAFWSISSFETFGDLRACALCINIRSNKIFSAQVVDTTHTVCHKLCMLSTFGVEAGPLEAISVIFGRSSLYFFVCLKAVENMKNNTTLLITFETQKC